MELSQESQEIVAETMLDRVSGFVEQYRAGADPGGRLPSDTAIARALGVSDRSVRSAMTVLSRRGTVVRIQGKGTFLPGGSRFPERDPRPLSSCDTIVQWIRNSIIRGTIRQGEPLPSVKYIAVHFRIARKTVSAAYRRLHEQGFVEKVGKSYWVGSFHALVEPGNKGIIQFFSPHGKTFEGIFNSPLLGLSYQYMTDELFARGYTPRFDELRELSERKGVGLPAKEPPHAVCFCSMDVEDHAVVRDWLAWIHRSPRRPRVLIDSWARASDLFPRNVSQIQRGSVGTAIARELARYSASVPFDEVIWHLEEKANVIFGLMGFIRLWVELQAGNPAVAVRLSVHTPMSRREYLEKRLMERMGWFRNFARSYPGVRIDRILDSISVVDEARPWQVRRTRGATLWVCADKGSALALLRHARAKNIAIPGRLSILTLEDGVSLLGRGLGCCTLDHYSAGHTMAHALIGDVPVPRTTMGFLRLQARIRHRSTAIPAG